jgi:hypothetical protein
MSNKMLKEELYSLVKSVAPGLMIKEYDDIVTTASRIIDKQPMRKYANNKQREMKLLGTLLDVIDNKYKDIYASKENGPKYIRVAEVEDATWEDIEKQLLAETEESNGEYSQSSKTYVGGDNHAAMIESSKEDTEYDGLWEGFGKEFGERKDGDPKPTQDKNLWPPRSDRDFSMGR